MQVLRCQVPHVRLTQKCVALECHFAMSLQLKLPVFRLHAFSNSKRDVFDSVICCSKRMCSESTLSWRWVTTVGTCGWTGGQWPGGGPFFKEKEAIVCTPAILLSLLRRSFIKVGPSCCLQMMKLPPCSNWTSVLELQQTCSLPLAYIRPCVNLILATVIAAFHSI